MGFFTDFRKSLRESVVDITQLPDNHVIFSYSNGPEPSGPYCAISTMNDYNDVCRPYTGTLASDEKLEISSVYEITVSFSFYGKDSGDLCSSFFFGLNNVVNIENLLAKNIGIMRKGKPQYKPEKRDTKWVERYIVTVVFSVTAFTEQQVDVIETVIYEDLLGITHTIP